MSPLLFSPIDGTLTKEALVLPSFRSSACDRQPRDILLPLTSIESFQSGGDGECHLEISARDQGEAAVYSITVDMSLGVALRVNLARLLAANRAAAHAEVLLARGRAEAPRTAECFHCRGEVCLTGLEDTPQMYCPACGATQLNARHAAIVSLPASMRGVFPPDRASESLLRQCEECSLAAQPVCFNVFYCFFYLLFVGLSWGFTLRCPGCMSRKAWVMLALNLPFLVGVPNAFAQLRRIHDLLAPDNEEPLAPLNRATKCIRDGEPREARTDYYYYYYYYPPPSSSNFFFLCLFSF